MLKIFLLLSQICIFLAHRHHNIIINKNITHSVKNKTCNYEICPEDRGICSLDNICYCLPGYITVNNSEFGDFKCNYIQKSQMVAFLLEFLLSFGSGHFYLNNYFIATTKFIFCLSFLVVTCFLPYLASKENNKQLASLTPYLQFISMVLFCCWQIFDSILFGLNRYLDGNGVKLQPW